MKILTNRFILKTLNLSNVSQRYVDWLNDHATSQFISERLSLEGLRKYVNDRSNRNDVLFLGIFNKADGQHIGNIKYEPIECEKRQATMGILIGEKDWRGKGVASEVIIASAMKLNERLKIEKILLGVNRNNLAAIRAYEKSGFKKISCTADNLKMQLVLKVSKLKANNEL
jgi:ribosomal-protein-alanine N-acetyltransferase